MASIHKDAKSPFWYCSYSLLDGRRAHRSTRQTDRKKAWDFCRSLERASEKARAGELTAVTARKLLDDLLESVGQSPLPKETVRSFCSSWLAAKAGSLKPAVYRLYDGLGTKFLEFLGRRADCALASATPSDIAAWRSQRLGADHVATGTVRLELKILRSFFSQARRQGLILHNPAEAIELPTHRPLQREVFTPHEIRALLAAASSEWRTMVLLGYYLGARLSDASSMRWENVDLAAAQVRYRQSKTGREIIVPLHADLAAHLLELASSDSPDTYLCPRLARTRRDGRCGLCAQFGVLMKTAGIDPGHMQSAKIRFSRKSYHALRHSFASALANAGVAPELRMKLTGHRSAQVHQTYTHLELAPLREAVALLPGVRIATGAT